MNGIKETRIYVENPKSRKTPQCVRDISLYRKMIVYMRMVVRFTLWRSLSPYRVFGLSVLVVFLMILSLALFLPGVWDDLFDN